MEQLKFLRKGQEAKRQFSYFPMLSIEKSEHFRQLSAEQLDAEIDDLQDVHEEETIARFRRQYYAKRWGGDVSAAVSVEQRKQIVLDYVRGLQFCIDYYFHGCRSWIFFYAHHYASLLCDMALIAGDNERTSFPSS